MRRVCEQEAAEIAIEAEEGLDRVPRPLMALQPIGPTSKLSPDPARWEAWYIGELERDLRGRGSKFEWRRRRAYQACQRLIEHREHVCGLATWEPPPSPSVPAKPWQVIAADYHDGVKEMVSMDGTVATVDDDRIDVKRTWQ